MGVGRAKNKRKIIQKPQTKKDNEDFYYLDIFHKNFFKEQEINSAEIVKKIIDRYTGDNKGIVDKHKWLKDEIKLRQSKEAATESWKNSFKDYRDCRFTF